MERSERIKNFTNGEQISLGGVMRRGEISDGVSSDFIMPCELNGEFKELNISYLLRII